jgi:hemoglobin
MSKEIETIDDIKMLIDHFYSQVIQDPVIGHFFTTTIKMNWEKHLPVMYSFWENALFYTGGYTGNPMIIHQRIHQVFHLKAEHFDRWTFLFCAAVDYHFAGEKADLAKKTALNISSVMQIKLLNRI